MVATAYAQPFLVVAQRVIIQCLQQPCNDVDYSFFIYCTNENNFDNMAARGRLLICFDLAFVNIYKSLLNLEMSLAAPNLKFTNQQTFQLEELQVFTAVCFLESR